MKFSNQLSDAELERLALLSEELGEAQQIIGKILRHGYESKNPHIVAAFINRHLLELELGHVVGVLTFMSDCGDIDQDRIDQAAAVKMHNAKPYLHHQSLASQPSGVRK